MGLDGLVWVFLALVGYVLMIGTVDIFDFVENIRRAKKKTLYSDIIWCVLETYLYLEKWIFIQFCSIDLTHLLEIYQFQKHQN